MKSPLGAARDGFQRYGYSDGLAEISVGVIMVFAGGSLLPDLTSEDSPLHYILGAVGVLSFLAFAVFQTRIVSAIRESVVFRRIGYATPEVGVKKRWRIVVGITMLSSFVSGFLLYRFRSPVANWSHWVPTLLGFVLGAALVADGARKGMRRFVLAGGVSIWLGLVLSLLDWDLGQALGSYFVGMGLTLLFTGGTTLRRLARTAPVDANEA